MLRNSRTIPKRFLARPALAASAMQTRAAHAISNPTLLGLETRWEYMSEEEREDIVSQLAERQKLPWSELTAAEKKAAWYISYGAWGPRKPVHAPGSVQNIILGVLGVFGAAGAVFGFARYMSQGLPKTMSKEWQEAVNEELKQRGTNPFGGFNQVQSSATGLDLEASGDDDDE